MHVLFVCTGNICRSPTAERLAVAYSARFQIPDFTASSAGTRAVIGHPIHRDAVPVLENLGGTSSAFAARQLNARVVSGADLVLTMTKAHREVALELAPHRLNRTFNISEAATLVSDFGAETIADLAALRPRLGQQKVTDIPDPIGQDADVFAAIGSQIANLLQPILQLCQTHTTQSGSGP